MSGEQRKIRFGSVCSGIEAASVAFGPLGWEAAWFSEIEPFPCAVLAFRFPNVPNLGDMTKLPERILSGEVEAPEVFVGGTPCQAFSFAGKRQSLDDARGNLSLVFCEIADAIDSARSVRGLAPAVVFWENVPGVLSTKDNAFGCFLGRLSGSDSPLSSEAGRWPSSGLVTGPKRKIAWRILDAQYFGVPQRRRRVFVVASARNGGGQLDPAKVLFERKGLRGDSAPSSGSGQSTSEQSGSGVEESGADNERIAGSLTTDLEKGATLQQMASGAFAFDGDVVGGGQSIGLDRASFNQGKNAKFGFQLLDEQQPTLTSRGPGAVLQHNPTKNSLVGGGETD